MRNLAILILVSMCTICSVCAKEIKVAGYTKKDGTKVAGYTKTVKDKDDKKSETKSDAKAETKTDTKADAKTEPKTETKTVAGYTKKDGTKVKGYTRAVTKKN